MIFGRTCGKGWIYFILGAVAILEPAGGAQQTANPRDTLVYKDGDRVQGVLVERTAETIVFKSDRFGELRVAAADAVVIKAEKVAAGSPGAARPLPAPAKGAAPAKPAPVAAATKKEAVAAAERADEERVTIWDRFSPAVLTARVRNYFGPWHGRVSISTELVTDIAKRNHSSYEAHVQRKWKSDEVQINTRYDYNQTNDVATTDMLKVWGQWRHEFTKTLFAHYRPTSEWNRASRLRGLPNDYVLLQQEIGVGHHLFTKPSRKVRVGLSYNLFDTWNSVPVWDHASRGVVSLFEETEFMLPWRITLTQRGVWYPISDQRDGWEHRFEVIKKLTETLSISVRHELRRNNPNGSAQNYDRLKLMFGLDF